LASNPEIQQIFEKQASKKVKREGVESNSFIFAEGEF